jgi:hypothetical protein
MNNHQVSLRELHGHRLKQSLVAVSPASCNPDWNTGYYSKGCYFGCEEVVFIRATTLLRREPQFDIYVQLEGIFAIEGPWVIDQSLNGLLNVHVKTLGSPYKISWVWRAASHYGALPHVIRLRISASSAPK